MDEVKKNWLVIVFSGVISLMVSLTLLSMDYKREDTKEINNKLDEKATKIELKETYTYIDKQDNSIVHQLQMHQEEDKQREEITQKWMQSIDAKLNILITKR